MSYLVCRLVKCMTPHRLSHFYSSLNFNVPVYVVTRLHLSFLLGWLYLGGRGAGYGLKLLYCEIQKEENRKLVFFSLQN